MPRCFCLSVFCCVSLLLLCSEPAAGQTTAWSNVNFDWTAASSWTWDNFGTDTPLPSRVTSQAGQLLLYYDPNKQYSDPGFQGPMYSTESFGDGSKAFYVEWTANDQSATVIELLSKELMAEGQFSSTNCWPNCGEIDVYEMLLKENTNSVAYGAPSNYGQTTLHKGSRASACTCPSLGGKETWYENTQPMTSGCSAQWQNRPNAKNSLVTIIDQDSTGQFIQLIQDPVITKSKDGSYSITAGSTSLSSQKMYNSAQSFYGTMPPSDCPQGDPDLATGWPFYNQSMHLILWEQDYTAPSGDTLGQFVVTDIQIFVNGNGNGKSFASQLLPTSQLLFLLMTGVLLITCIGGI